MWFRWMRLCFQFTLIEFYGIGIFMTHFFVVFFFFQAEDGIRDLTVTGVQTCALPICDHRLATMPVRPLLIHSSERNELALVECAGGEAQSSRQTLHAKSIRDRYPRNQIGRASCRERV